MTFPRWAGTFAVPTISALLTITIAVCFSLAYEKNKNKKSQSSLRNCYEPDQTSFIPRKSQNWVEKTNQEHRRSAPDAAFQHPDSANKQTVLVSGENLAQTNTEVTRRCQKV